MCSPDKRLNLPKCYTRCSAAALIFSVKTNIEASGMFVRSCTCEVQSFVGVMVTYGYVRLIE